MAGRCRPDADRLSRRDPRVRDLTLQAATGANGANERRAMAVEILAIRDSLVGLANTQQLGRPVFGGTADGVAPYASDGTFQITGPAATGVVERTVAPGDRVQVNLTGPEVFGTEPDNLFNVLTRLADDLLANDTSNMTVHLNDVDVRTRGITDALGEIGARVNRVEAMKARAEAKIITLRSSLSEVEDIDLPATIMDLQVQETASRPRCPPQRVSCGRRWSTFCDDRHHDGAAGTSGGG